MKLTLSTLFVALTASHVAAKGGPPGKGGGGGSSEPEIIAVETYFTHSLCQTNGVYGAMTQALIDAGVMPEGTQPIVVTNPGNKLRKTRELQVPAMCAWCENLHWQGLTCSYYYGYCTGRRAEERELVNELWNGETVSSLQAKCDVAMAAVAAWSPDMLENQLQTEDDCNPSSFVCNVLY